MHVVDRDGNPTPTSSALAYEARSVAVPFGNCTEPSNVKAGGQNCPIRFQCSGCGFYRPDPSFLPAIEDHIRALKADLETAQALGAAAFVIGNLRDQIDSFQTVVTRIRAKLAAMPEGERHQIEEASTILRKIRASAPAPVLPIPPDPREEHPVTPRRTPADVLRQARQQDSRTKRSRVVATVAKMLEDQEPIAFTSVARTAKVSHWLVYAAGVREHIDRARRQQAQQATRGQADEKTTAPAGLKVELEVLREDNRRLRREREQLQRALRRDLGRQLDQIGTTDLEARVDELAAANRKLTADLAAAKQELAETQDSLAAARVSLRRMIRTENQTHC